MNMVQTLAHEASDFRKKGEIQEALEVYSKAFDVLIDEAGVYARAQERAVTDIGELRERAPILLEHSKDYLRRTIDAASLLNTMGELFAELGDYENARQKLLEALEFIPNNIVYDEPLKNLELVVEKQQLAAQRTQDNEETI